MPPIGELALYFALAIAILLTVIPAIGYVSHQSALLKTAKPLTIWLFVLVLIAFIFLGYLFYTNDFSYLYVYSHSNTRLPTIYKLTAIWGSHEGSMLLWVLTLTFWMLLAAIYLKKIPLELSAMTLSILGFIAAAFILFVLLTSNPFDRIINQIVFDGQELNPLLQDFGLVIHPPLLYMGYVGFAIPYAFICASLITGFIDRQTTRWLRPWVLAAWGLLTLGIAIGSWWAYYELGWGGWWFWDPVENASLIPWVLSTALLHSLIATEKRQVFSIWSALLAILAFSLSVLGTFLVRSGVLTSVHSFAADPRRGAAILLILAIVVCFGVLLLVFRAHRIRQNSTLSLLSKESGILVNNIFLSIICFIIILGTLYPLIVDFLGIGKISVGPSYFNQYVNPLSLILLIFLAITPLVRFKKDTIGRLKKQIIFMAIMAIILGVFSNFLYVLLEVPESNAINFTVSLTLSLCYFVLLGIILEINQHKKNSDNWLQGFFKQPLSRMGMNLGHLSIIVTIVGITMTSHYSAEEDRLVTVGKTETVRSYAFTLEKLDYLQGPNYTATKGTFTVMHNGKFVKTMYPEKRLFAASGMPMSEVALRPSLLDDLYIALAEERSPNTWAIRLYVKPFVRWIWLGGVLMAIAALISIIGLREKRKNESL